MFGFKFFLWSKNNPTKETSTFKLFLFVQLVQLRCAGYARERTYRLGADSVDKRDTLSKQQQTTTDTNTC